VVSPRCLHKAEPATALLRRRWVSVSSFKVAARAASPCERVTSPSNREGVRIANTVQCLPCSNPSRVGYAARFAALPLTGPARGTGRACMSAMRTSATGWNQANAAISRQITRHAFRRRALIHMLVMGLSGAIWVTFIVGGFATRSAPSAFLPYELPWWLLWYGRIVAVGAVIMGTMDLLRLALSLRKARA
jgi:hypothetical protein